MPSLEPTTYVVEKEVPALRVRVILNHPTIYKLLADEAEVKARMTHPGTLGNRKVAAANLVRIDTVEEGEAEAELDLIFVEDD